MAEHANMGSPIVRIGIRLRVGESLMAASDDPLFLGLRGPSGREFRLDLARGRALRRGSEDRYVLGAASAPETNVAHPELNDPTAPPLDADDVQGVYLRKGQPPLPNVRGIGEMDDRLEIIEAEVEIHADGRNGPVCFARRGPFWLGLVSGQRVELRRSTP